MGNSIGELQKYQEKMKRKEEHQRKKEEMRRKLYAEYKAKKLREMDSEQREDYQEAERDKQLLRDRKRKDHLEQNKKVDFQMDEKGRIIDKEGKVMNLKQDNVQTLKINLNKVKEQKVKEMFKIQRANLIQEKHQAFYDKAVVHNNEDRRLKRRTIGLSFIQQGTFIKKAEMLRNSQNSTLAIPQNITRTHVPLRHHEPVPDVEWWDTHLLKNQKQYFQTVDEDSQASIQLALDNIDQADVWQQVDTRKLARKQEVSPEQHSQWFKTAGNNVVIPMYLTKEE